ncbi:MAG: chromate efflux transporter [Planctomycetota bacterium]
MGRLGEIAAVFTKLGFLAFGGPAAHVAMMEDELVDKRHWLDREHFLSAVSAVQIVPGPNSTELAIHMGWLRGGFAGLVVAGACFIGPAVLIILPLAWLYVAGQQGAYRPWLEALMGGIAPVVLAIIVNALVRFAQTSCRTPFHAALAIGGAVGAVVLTGTVVQREIVVLAVAAGIGMAWSLRPAGKSLAIALPATLPAVADAHPTLLELGWFMLKVGGTLFGSGYVLVSYLQSGLVEQRGWLTEPQLLDAIAVGQTTPGPLLTTATFVGYVVGAESPALHPLTAALLATAAMFGPSFVFVALFSPVLEKLRGKPLAKAALLAMNAAVVGLIAVVALELLAPATTFATSRADPASITLAVAALAVLLWKNPNATWLILVGAGYGLIRHGLTRS